MGTTGTKIVDFDVKELINLLNKALADEWLAYYQYWVSAQIATGPMRADIAGEFSKHAEEEFKHANMLTKRIIQLGGSPILDPSEWSKMANCAYHKPTDPHVKPLLQINIKGEQCAIVVYKQLLRLLAGKDELTYNMVLDILNEEVEHEDDLEMLLQDIG